MVTIFITIEGQLMKRALSFILAADYQISDQTWEISLYSVVKDGAAKATAVF